MQNASNNPIAALGDLEDIEVAEGSLDVRGWEVTAGDGKKIGDVNELLVDAAAGRVRYLDVEVDKAIARSKGEHVLIPIGAAQLDDSKDRVRVGALATPQVQTLPRYTEHQTLTREYEASVVKCFGAAVATGAETPGDFYAAKQFDDSHFAASRRPAKAHEGTGEQRLTVSEEELSVSTRQASAGEVGVGKTVSTEHVQKTVPVSREEVTIERRPIEAGKGKPIAEDEIRIPLTKEELVTEKRVVGKEEVIIKKKTITEDETVEADLRRERVDVDQGQARQSGVKQAPRDTGGDAKRTAEGLGDKMARGLDNLKDRIDGDPASQPGPDPTDRRR